VIRLAGKPIAQVGNAVIYIHLGLDENTSAAAATSSMRQARALAQGRRRQTRRRARRADREAAQGRLHRRRPRRLQAGAQGLCPGSPARGAAQAARPGLRVSEIPRGLVHEAGFTRWLVQHAKATAPLVVWLHRYIG